MRITKLEKNDDGSYTVVYEWQTFRFLLEDGSTIDVRAVHDDSTLRGMVVSATKTKRIEGVAYLPVEPVVEEKKAPAKKAPAKKIGQQRAS